MNILSSPFDVSFSVFFSLVPSLFISLVTSSFRFRMPMQKVQRRGSFHRRLSRNLLEPRSACRLYGHFVFVSRRVFSTWLPGNDKGNDTDQWLSIKLGRNSFRNSRKGNRSVSKIYHSFFSYPFSPSLSHSMKNKTFYPLVSTRNHTN